MSNEWTEKIEKLEREKAEWLEACKKTWDTLNNMTTEEYSFGNDKPIREMLAKVISLAEGKEGE